MVVKPLRVRGTIEAAFSTFSTNLGTLVRVTWFTALITTCLPFVVPFLGGWWILFLLFLAPLYSIWIIAVYRITLLKQSAPSGWFYFYFGPLEKTCSLYFFALFFLLIGVGAFVFVFMIFFVGVGPTGGLSVDEFPVVLFILLLIPLSIFLFRFTLRMSLSAVLIASGFVFNFPRFWELHRQSHLLLQGNYLNAFFILLLVALIFQLLTVFVSPFAPSNPVTWVGFLVVLIAVTWLYFTFQLCLFGEMYKSLRDNFANASDGGADDQSSL